MYSLSLENILNKLSIFSAFMNSYILVVSISQLEKLRSLLLPN